MPISARLSSLEFTGGQSVQLSPDELLIVVGPNNSGKSTLLREIREHMQSGTAPDRPPRVVVRTVGVSNTGELDEFMPFLEARARRTQSGTQIVFRGLGINVAQGNAPVWWRAGPGFHEMTAMFCRLVETSTRLGAAHPAQKINHTSDSVVHPIQILEDDDQLEMQFSRHTKAAFGMDLIVDHWAGATIPLRIGDRPLPGPGEDRMSKAYKERVRAIQELQSQGDGMKSFVGTLLSVAILRPDILLVDEPEAFLHPPQARMIGRLIAQEHSGRKQIIVATHSNDVLRGLLDGATTPPTILRLSRAGNLAQINSLAPADVRTLWSDPILRFSSALEGLFHEGLVICESDGDCRFYSAVLSCLVEGKDDVRPPDLLFTPSGGKDRIPVIAQALKRIGVDVKVIADFDLLSDDRKLREIIEALGGNWEELEGDYRPLKQSLDQRSPGVRTTQVVSEIGAILEGVSGELFPAAAREEIKKILRSSSYWSVVKSSGLSAVAAGDLTTRARRLLERCGQLGLWIVPVGELECFDKQIGVHGPAWVARVLSKNLATDPDLREAREFVARLAGLQLRPEA